MQFLSYDLIVLNIPFKTMKAFYAIKLLGHASLDREYSFFSPSKLFINVTTAQIHSDRSYENYKSRLPRTEQSYKSKVAACKLTFRSYET